MWNDVQPAAFAAAIAPAAEMKNVASEPSSSARNPFTTKKFEIDRRESITLQFLMQERHEQCTPLAT